MRSGWSRGGCWRRCGTDRCSSLVAVSRQMFKEILSLIARLRVPPAPA
jgi:hypothetical protein